MMATLKENIKQAIADFDDVKSAIEESGVEVPYDTNTSEYGNLVRKAVAKSSNGGSYVVDGKSITVENDEIKIVGFEAAEAGAQPRKSEDGTVEWVVPSAESVEGLEFATDEEVVALFT